MQLVTLDWVIVVLSIAVAFLPAVLLARRAGSSTAEFFTSGRAAPWWLIGVSMVATTFSTDTPNPGHEPCAQCGVASNWAWWAFLLTGMATVFFYARLWRRIRRADRPRVLRAALQPAAPPLVVRGFRAVYLGLFFNCVIMASVNLAAAKIANVLLGWPMWQTLLICGGDQHRLRRDLGPLGRARDGLHPVRHRHGGLVRRRVLRASSSPKSAGSPGSFAKLDPEVHAARARARLQRLAADGHRCRSSSRSRCSGGPASGIRAPSRAAAATSRSVCWRAKSERDAMAGTLFFNVAHYALPLLAVDHRGTRLACWSTPTLDSTSAWRFPNVDPRAHRPRHGLPGDAQVPAARLPRPDDRRHVGGVCLDAGRRTSTGASSYLVHDFYRRFVRTDATEQPLRRCVGRLDHRRC